MRPLGAFTSSWPSVKFSRFHSSQQCDERKAVELSARIIAKIPRSCRKNLPLRTLTRQPRPSFRGIAVILTLLPFASMFSLMTIQFAIFMPKTKKPENTWFSGLSPFRIISDVQNMSILTLGLVHMILLFIHLPTLGIWQSAVGLS